MRKLIQSLLIFGCLITAAVAYRGNLAPAGPEPDGGFVLKSSTDISWPSYVQSKWRQNLGLGDAGLQIPSGAPTTLAQGSVVVSGSDVKIYLTGSTGLIIATGTTTPF